MDRAVNASEVAPRSRPRGRDRFVAGALLAVSVGAFLLGRDYPRESALFPMLTSALLAASSIALFVGTFRSVPDSHGPDSAPAWGRFAVTITATLCLVFLFGRLGAYPTVWLYLLIMFLTLSKLRPVWSLVLSVGMTGALWVVFDLLLAVPTPDGVVARFFG